MEFRRPLVLVELGTYPREVMSALRLIAPAATSVTIVAQQAPRQFAWLTAAAPPLLGEAAGAALERLREAASEVAPQVEVLLSPELELEALARNIAAAAIDVVVVGPLSARAMGTVAELRRERSIPILFAPQDRGASAELGVGLSQRGRREAARPLTRLLCVALSARGRSTIAAFLLYITPASHRANLI
jgi:hypothetical protein